GSWAVNQDNARCGPGARATSFGEARANDELSFTSFARVGAGGCSSGRSSPSTSTGRLSPTASTGGTTNASQATAGGGSSGRLTPTTSTGGTSNAPQPTAGGASSGRSSTVPPLGDDLAQDMGDIAISELSQLATATREEADYFLNAVFTRDLVRPEKATAMMTALIDEKLLGERGGVRVDECLADAVEYDETDFVPGFVVWYWMLCSTATTCQGMTSTASRVRMHSRTGGMWTIIRRLRNSTTLRSSWRSF
ncbi:unnamed protein product, partial [Ascophyllum nodosum]